MSSGTRGNGQNRRDQWQCPQCGKWGCPTEGGSKVRGYRIVRYRKCSHCSHTFTTEKRRQRDGTYGPEILG